MTSDHPVLTGIDMVIPRGKVVAIMGISGSGKDHRCWADRRLVHRRRVPSN